MDFPPYDGELLDIHFRALQFLNGAFCKGVRFKYPDGCIAIGQELVARATGAATCSARTGFSRISHSAWCQFRSQ